MSNPAKTDGRSGHFESLLWGQAVGDGGRLLWVGSWTFERLPRPSRNRPSFL